MGLLGVATSVSPRALWRHTVGNTVRNGRGDGRETQKAKTRTRVIVDLGEPPTVSGHYLWHLPSTPNYAYLTR